MTVPIIVLGSVNVDLVVRGDRLPQPGETVIGGEFYQAAGGKGANQAVAAARAGREPVAIIGAVGNDSFGELVRHRLAQESLICDHLRTILDAPTGVALIMVDKNGENSISVASGANSLLTEADVDAIPQELLKGAKVFLTSLELPLPVVRRGLLRAKSAGLTTILNPAPARRWLLDEIAAELIDVITPNEHEGGQLLGEGSAAMAAAPKIRKMGVGAVVVTLGASGCLVVAEETLIVPAPRVTPVDTTAAGDAFNGALAVQLAEGVPLAVAARWATSAAALCTTRKGAQPSLPTRDQIDAMAAEAEA